MGPHSNMGAFVHETKVPALRLPLHAFMRVVYLDAKERVVVSRFVLAIMCSELGVGGHERTGDIVRHEDGVGVDVQELHNVSMSHNAPSAAVGYFFGRQHHPVIVRVVESVASHLLALTAYSSIVVLQRVLIWVRVQESFSSFMLYRKGVVISDL